MNTQLRQNFCVWREIMDYNEVYHHLLSFCDYVELDLTRKYYHLLVEP